MRDRSRPPIWPLEPIEKGAGVIVGRFPPQRAERIGAHR